MKKLLVLCPFCFTPMEVSRGFNTDQAPEPGNVSLCWHCAEFAVFVNEGDGLALRTPYPEELEIIASSPDAAEARAVRRKVRADAEGPLSAIEAFRRAFKADGGPGSEPRMEDGLVGSGDGEAN